MGRFLRHVRLLLAAALALGLMVVGVQSAAAATTWVVDDDFVQCSHANFNTISAAVAASSANDTIEVCPGVYNESVIVSHPLTFLGPNAGISWDGTRGPEAFVNSPGITFLMIPGDGVTLDGFTITGNFGIYVTGSANNTLIQNNITTGVIRALTSDSGGSSVGVLDNRLISNVRSFHLDGAYTNMVVSGNRFEGAAASAGIFFSAGPPNSIAGFTFIENEVLHPANMASNISNATVSENIFDPALPGDEALLISLQNSFVTDNTFEGDDSIACLRLWGNEIPGIVVPSEHVTISDNTFSDCGTADPATNYAIQLGPEVHHIDITNNEISSGFEGVNTGDTALWDVTNEIHINFNNITDNTSFGVRNGQMGVLDAECNWWGAADGPGPVGPGSGDNVSTNVDFTPWLIAPAPGGPCVGGADTPGKVTGGGQVDGDPLFSPFGDLISLPALVPSLAGGSSNSSFGFVVRCCPRAGNLSYHDHGMDVRIKATSIDGLSITSPGESCPTTPGSKHATFQGMADVIRPTGTTNEFFFVEVDDCGEPGANDTFGIDAETYDKAPSKLIGGNIQIKQ